MAQHCPDGLTLRDEGAIWERRKSSSGENIRTQISVLTESSQLLLHTTLSINRCVVFEELCFLAVGGAADIDMPLLVIFHLMVMPSAMRTVPSDGSYSLGLGLGAIVGDDAAGLPHERLVLR